VGLILYQQTTWSPVPISAGPFVELVYGQDRKRPEKETGKGGNHVFGDGSGAWVAFREMRRLQSHGATRALYYFQNDLGDQIPPLP